MLLSCVLCLAALSGALPATAFAPVINDLHAAMRERPTPASPGLSACVTSEKHPPAGRKLLRTAQTEPAMQTRYEELQQPAENVFFSIEQLFDEAGKSNPHALYLLGVHYENGTGGLCKDDPLAVAWLLKAAESGDARAQFNIGKRCFFGQGVTRNLGMAVLWMKKAAMQDIAEAQYRLAGFLEDGLGTPEDMVQALYWYGRAAELGLPQAQNMLGIWNMQGVNMQQDKAKAALWFRQAAVQGYATAQYNLARCYELGDGVDKNMEEALLWYKKAARQGDTDAKKRLNGF